MSAAYASGHNDPPAGDSMDAMRFMTFGDVLKQMPHVDDLDAAERAKTDGALEAALSHARPPNWWGTGANQPLLLAAREDGLALAWIPRAEIVQAVDAAADHVGRVAILMARQAEIIEDCKAALEECDEDELEDTVYLAQCAIDALVCGHYEASMALAVSMGEPLAMWASTPRVRGYGSRADKEQWEKYLRDLRSRYSYAQAEICRLGPGPVEYWDFSYQVLVAPIPSFFTAWKPEWATPPPAALSRHVVAHLAPREHFTPENALLAVMLVVSILREQQEWTREVRIDDAGAEAENYEGI